MENQLRLVFLLIVWGLAAPFSSAQTAPSAEVPISVTINAPSSEMKAGSELKLGVVMTNTSDEQVGLTTWPEDFRMDVLDSEGKVVGKAQAPSESTTNRKAGDVLRPVQGQGSSQGLKLAPHRVHRWQEDLSKEFDLSKPGKYTVQATRMYGKVPVRSNVITITVLP